MAIMNCGCVLVSMSKRNSKPKDTPGPPHRLANGSIGHGRVHEDNRLLGPTLLRLDLFLQLDIKPHLNHIGVRFERHSSKFWSYIAIASGLRGIQVVT